MSERDKQVNFLYYLKGIGEVEQKLHWKADEMESRAINERYMVEVPAQISEMCEYIKSFGGRALVVGGAVRDAVIRKELGEQVKPKDFDLEVYGLEANSLLQILERKYGYIGIEGLKYRIMKVKVEGIFGRVDVSVPRTEKSVGIGHKQFEIVGDVAMSIKQAAERRDVTVNSMAYDPLTRTIYDPFGGIEDVRLRMLRMTKAEAFGEDPLRVMRLVQFVPRLGFDVDYETFCVAKEMVVRGYLDKEPKERWTEELQKLLLKGKVPSKGLRLAEQLGIVERFWPEINALRGLPQQPEWHPEGDVWTHTLQCIDAAAEIRDREEMEDKQALGYMLGILLHDTGKAVKTAVKRANGDVEQYVPGVNIGPQDKIISYGHEAAGKEPAQQFLGRYIFSTYSSRQAIAYVVEHMQPKALWLEHEKGQRMDGPLRRLAKRLQPADVTLRGLAHVAEADQRGRNGKEQRALSVEEVPELKEWQAWYFNESKRLRVLDCAPEPILRGQHVIEKWADLKPGEWVGKILKEVLELQFSGKVISLNQALVEAERIFEKMAIQGLVLI